MTVYVVIDTYEDREYGEERSDVQPRCFATRELAEEVARVDGGTVHEWEPIAELPEPTRRLSQNAEWCDSRGDATLRVSPPDVTLSYYGGIDPDNWWRQELGYHHPNFTSAIVGAWTPDVTEHREWFTERVARLEADPLAFVNQHPNDPGQFSWCRGDYGPKHRDYGKETA